MSTFKAEVVRVEVLPHPQADRLDLVKVKGWQTVSQKGMYKSGDLAVYLPVDSVLPAELVKQLGIEKNYHRKLRTIKLRGAISQGMVMPLPPPPDSPTEEPQLWDEGDDLTSFLGITKYEEPIPIHMAGVQLPEHPNMIKYTDIENIKNFPDVFQPGEPVFVTEKIHGSNFRVGKFDGKLQVGSHRINLAENADNLYWRAAKLLDAENYVLEGEIVFGEVYGHGVQDLTYGIPQGQIRVAIFDIFRDGRFLNQEELAEALESRSWNSVPVPLAIGIPFGPEVLAAVSGNSILEPSQVKEGIVIRPLIERYSERLQGRLIIKAINDEYLIRKDATERH